MLDGLEKFIYISSLSLSSYDSCCEQYRCILLEPLRYDWD